MKFLHKLTLAMVLLFSAFWANAALFSISEADINRYLQTKLADKVALQDKVGIPGLFQLNYHLHDLNAQIGQTEEKRVALKGLIDAVLKVKGKNYDTQLMLNFDSEPYYDPESGALYLKDLRLTEWSSSNEKHQQELQMFLPILAEGLASLLNSNPVYTLDDSKTKEALIKKWGKAIVVEKGELKLETSFF